MTNLPSNAQNPENAVNEDIVKELLRKLRQKQGNWVEWGAAIASLQKAGYNPQQIFEETGFEPLWNEGCGRWVCCRDDDGGRQVGEGG